MTIPYGRQSISDEDIEAVVGVLKGDWLTQGPAIEAFERSVAEYCEAEHAVAFNSGTATLHAAAEAGGIGPNSLLVTSPLTFMASVNAGRYLGANVELVDIESATLNLDLSLVPDNADALVPVHFAGLPVDLASMANPPALIIEDAAHALGAQTPDGPVGNCANSDACSFSFHPVKPITSAEGGIVTTNNAELAERMRAFRTHGIERRPDKGGWYYEIVREGFNYRLSDLHAALGMSQMAKLDRFIARRNEIAERYRAELGDAPLILPPAAPDGFVHGYHLFAVQVPERDRVFAALREADIWVQVHYVPVHHHPVSKDIPQTAADLPNCETAYSGLISLPMFPDLTNDDQTTVIETLKSLL